MANPKRKPSMPATEQLAELAARSHACNGLLLPLPEQITRQSVLAYLQAIAEIGSPGHVEIAWYKINNGALKQAMMNDYVQIHAAAATRHNEIERRAAAEQEAERMAWLERKKRTDRARSIASLEAEIAALKA